MLQRVLISLAVLITAVFAFVGYTTFSGRHADPGTDTFGATGSRPRAEQQSVPFPTADASDNTSGNTTSLVTSGGSSSANGIAPPTTDSIAADPPNGLKFGASGHYQLYRQGDLTWRLNTDTGQTCVLFATDEQWRKPKVYQSGCRGRS